MKIISCNPEMFPLILFTIKREIYLLANKIQLYIEGEKSENHAMKTLIGDLVSNLQGTVHNHAVII